MSVHRQQIVLQILLFSTGFLASAIGLPRWRHPLRMSAPLSPSERRVGTDSPLPAAPPPEIAALTTPDAIFPAPSPARALSERLGQLREVLLDLRSRKTPSGRTCCESLELRLAGPLEHRIHHARQSLEKLSPGSWEELRSAVRANRSLWDAFIRNPENDSIARELLDLGSGAFWDSDLDVLVGLLSTGTKLQKLALLEKYRGAGWHGEGAEPIRRSLTEHYTSLLSDPDAEIRGAALASLVSYDRSALETRMAEVRGAWPPSADPREQLGLLGELASPPIPDAPGVHAFMLEKLADLFDSKEQRIRGEAVGILGRMASAGNPEDLRGCASLLGSSFRSTRDPEVYRDYLETSLVLPIAHLGRVLEEARASAPTPEIQRGIEQVLRELNGGETRPGIFRKILEDAIGLRSFRLDE